MGDVAHLPRTYLHAVCGQRTILSGIDAEIFAWARATQPAQLTDILCDYCGCRCPIDEFTWEDGTRLRDTWPPPENP